MEASSGTVDSRLLKSLSVGVGWDQNGGLDVT